MPSQEEVEIHTGYVPGSIGRVVEMHGRYYSQAAGFGQYFESKVAAGLAEFMGRLSNPGNGFWTARHAGEIVGSIAIDAEDMGPSIAHLRWFIVSDAVRGKGLGKRLLTQAVQFCDKQGFSEIHLWTFAGLVAARKLYESAGFFSGRGVLRYAVGQGSDRAAVRPINLRGTSPDALATSHTFHFAPRPLVCHACNFLHEVPMARHSQRTVIAVAARATATIMAAATG